MTCMLLQTACREQGTSMMRTGCFQGCMAAWSPQGETQARSTPQRHTSCSAGSTCGKRTQQQETAKGLTCLNPDTAVKGNSSCAGALLALRCICFDSHAVSIHARHCPCGHRMTTTSEAATRNAVNSSRHAANAQQALHLGVLLPEPSSCMGVSSVTSAANCGSKYCTHGVTGCPDKQNASTLHLTSGTSTRCCTHL